MEDIPELTDAEMAKARKVTPEETAMFAKAIKEKLMETEKKVVKIRIPSNSLVIMVAPSGAGKSALADRLFGKERIVSSDGCRRLIAGNLPSEELQKYSEGAFEMFRAWIRSRLRHGLLTVADSTALRSEYRTSLQAIANEEHVKTTHLWMDTSFEACLLNNAKRPENERVPEGVLKKQFASLNRSKGWLRNADNVIRIRPSDEVELVLVDAIQGMQAKAIDVIGDVHGCLEELVELIEKLGYTPYGREEYDYKEGIPATERLYSHPDGRILVFVGDLIDRGPEPYNTLDFVRRHVQAGLAELVLSNHERKLRNYLSGRNVNIKPEFQKTLDSIPVEVDKKGLKSFLYSLRPYRQWVSPSGEEWVVAHAAFDPKFAGKVDKEIEEYCAYGPVKSVDPVTHKPDRIAWWETYRPGPKVVYGHLITEDGKPRVVNGTYGIDTGCVHGGSLTALRLPEVEFVQVKAKQKYHGTEELPEGLKPVSAVPGTANLDILTSRRVTVRDAEGKNQDVFLHEHGLMDAIDNLSTRTVRPDKLVWLSPTMSPGPVSEDETAMEDPVTAAKWMFANAPEGTVLSAQVKHMGSRGTWLCEKRDGVWDIHCWTRNGYEMFDEPRRSVVYAAMQAPLTAVANGLSREGHGPEWQEIRTLLLDSEVMPFNQHGDEWLERTFMQTAAAGHVARFAQARAAKAGGHDALAARLVGRMENLKLYGDAANRFCWALNDPSEIRIGFFDILHPYLPTHSGKVRSLADSLKPWPMFRPTEFLAVVNTEESFAALKGWFDKLTGQDGVEGVVLKYDRCDQWSTSKFPQQMLKVRGKDYLRLVYGPQYLDPEILPALRRERRVETKQRMAYQQTLLGLEAIRRNFTEKRPFEDWHECVLSILAAERATVDPRL